MDSQEITAKLKSRYGIVKQASGGQLRIQCPTCTATDSKKCKRYIYPNCFYSKCYICEQTLTMEELLGDDAKYDRPVDTGPAPEHPQARICPCSGFTPINELDHNHPAVKFLHKDHLYNLDHYWENYRVCFVSMAQGVDVWFDQGNEPPTKVRTGDCILFPVVFKTEIVGWQVRYIPGTFWGDKAKMKYFHVYQKGRYLYNYDEAKKHENVVVVEGIKKALKIPNAVATLGKNVSDPQFQLLCEWRKITLLLDGDDKTQQLAEQLCDRFQGAPRDFRNIGLKRFGFPSPDEMTTEQINQVVQDAWK
jgi:hypothetical protein